MPSQKSYQTGLKKIMEYVSHCYIYIFLKFNSIEYTDRQLHVIECNNKVITSHHFDSPQQILDDYHFLTHFSSNFSCFSTVVSSVLHNYLSAQTWSTRLSFRPDTQLYSGMLFL